MENRKSGKASREFAFLTLIGGVYYKGIVNEPEPDKVVSDEGVDSLFQDDTKLVMIIDFTNTGKPEET